MPLERATVSLVDVLDRVLDKGIVVDAFVSISLIGIEVVTVEARVVIASIETYLGFARGLAEVGASTARGAALGAPMAAAIAGNADRGRRNIQRKVSPVH